MKTKLLFVAVASLIASYGAIAKDGKFNIKEQFNGSHISFASKGEHSRSTLSISGPDGFSINKASETGIPSVNLYQYDDLKDGLYHYEITVNTGDLVLIKDTINNGRGENNSHYARKGITKSGHFRVVNGQIKQYQNIKEPTFR